MQPPKELEPASPSSSFLSIPPPPPIPPPVAPPKPVPAPIPEPPPPPSFFGKIANLFKKKPAEQQPEQPKQPEQTEKKGFLSKIFSDDYKWFGGRKTKRHVKKHKKHGGSKKSKSSRKH